MVLVSKHERRQVYQYLLQEGVIVVQKDYKVAQHQELPVANLKVQMICRSLMAKGLLQVHFNWQWLYYYLNEKGIQEMRDYLGAPVNVVPETHKRTGPAPREEGEYEERGYRGDRGDRGERSDRAPRGDSDHRPRGLGRGYTAKAN
jgi:small subunit ribosomal protein S10e